MRTSESDARSTSGVADREGTPMYQEHARSALIARVQLERFEIRELDRELNAVTATATIEADVTRAVRSFLHTLRPGRAFDPGDAAAADGRCSHGTDDEPHGADRR
jgi:hypothetical protein